MRPAAIVLVAATCHTPQGAPAVDAGAPLVPLERRAARYAERGYYADSNRVYRQMAERAPASPDICAWQVNVVHNTLVAGDKRDQADELLRLAAVERELAARAGGPAQQTQECRRVLHDTLGDLISVWNRELTTGCTAYARRHWPLLEALFREFLATFPDDPKAPAFRRLLGDLLRREHQ